MDAQKLISELIARAARANLSMAEACRRAHIAESTLTRWKNGTFEPRFRVLSRFIKVIEDAEAAQTAALPSVRAH